MATNQELRQASVRAVTGTAYTYNEDWLALFSAAGFTTGSFGERMLAWINDYLGAAYTTLPDAMQAFAEDQGFTSWNEMGTFDASGTFDPASLFSASEKGVFYDYSDLSTLYQDTLLASPVTADGQTVARVVDKSPNGYNQAQDTASLRPVYKTSGGLSWLDFDQVDDLLASATIDLRPAAGTATWTLAMSYDVPAGDIILLHKQGLNGPWIGIGQSGSASTVLSDTTVTQTGLRVDGVLSAATTRGQQYTLMTGKHVTFVEFTMASGAATNWTLPSIGQYFGGAFGIDKIYSMLLINRALTADERASLLTYQAAKQGRTL